MAAMDLRTFIEFACRFPLSKPSLAFPWQPLAVAVSRLWRRASGEADAATTMPASGRALGDLDEASGLTELCRDLNARRERHHRG